MEVVRPLIASLFVCATIHCGTSETAHESEPDAGGLQEQGNESSDSGVLKNTVWHPIDFTFTASGTPNWRSFPLSATFTHSSGTEIKAEGFWDGGKTWKIRFSATKPGTWKWTTSSGDAGLDGKEGSFAVKSASDDQKQDNPNLGGPLQVAADKRTFVRTDGTPFFYFGDTAWDVGARAFGDFKRWADDRKAKGFTVAQIRYASVTKDNEGGYPFASSPGGSDNGDYSQIDPGYFQALDKRMNYLFEKGFVVAGHPNWMVSNRYSLAETQNLSRYLMARYGAYPLVWSLTGEYHEAESDWAADNYARVKQLGAFVASKNFYGHEMSIHPGGTDPGPPSPTAQSSAHHFHTQSWLSHNWLQTYDSPGKIPYRIDEALSYEPMKPVILSEGRYENRPNSSDPTDLQRRQAWVALLSGAAGFVYGAHGVFFFDDLTKLSLPGASDMARLIAFFRDNAIHLSALNPKVAGGQSCVRINGAAPDLLDQTHARCAGTAGNTYVLYAPKGSAGDTLVMIGLAQKSYKARWYNPATGTSTAVAGSPINTDLNDTWTVPPRPSANDWVLWLSQ